jgi:hypothetical protein
LRGHPPLILAHEKWCRDRPFGGLYLYEKRAAIVGKGLDIVSEPVADLVSYPRNLRRQILPTDPLEPGPLEPEDVIFACLAERAIGRVASSWIVLRADPKSC